eukprot:scaffold31862_cov63-Phaeocystis_antarctica.AAC.10
MAATMLSDDSNPITDVANSRLPRSSMSSKILTTDAPDRSSTRKRQLHASSSRSGQPGPSEQPGIVLREWRETKGCMGAVGASTSAHTKESAHE